MLKTVNFMLYIFYNWGKKVYIRFFPWALQHQWDGQGSRSSCCQETRQPPSGPEVA